MTCPSFGSCWIARTGVATPARVAGDGSRKCRSCHAHPIGVERHSNNTAKGHEALIARLRQWPVERIAYKATDTDQRALEAALTNWPCVKLNPKPARRFAQAIGTLARTDRIDAMLRARWLQTCSQRSYPLKAHSRPKCRSSSMPGTAWFLTAWR